MEIIELAKKVLFGPPCLLCGGRKDVVLNGEHYCRNCDKNIIDTAVFKKI